MTCRRRHKENQEELLDKVNQATLQMLTKNSGGAGSSGASGRKITDITAYKSVNEINHTNALAVQVDHKSECVLVPMYGMLVPFHILTIKNASNNQVSRFECLSPTQRHCFVFTLLLQLISSAFLPCRTTTTPTFASTSTSDLRLILA